MGVSNSQLGIKNLRKREIGKWPWKPSNIIQNCNYGCLNNRLHTSDLNLLVAIKKCQTMLLIFEDWLIGLLSLYAFKAILHCNFNLVSRLWSDVSKITSGWSRFFKNNVARKIKLQLVFLTIGQVSHELMTKTFNRF